MFGGNGYAAGFIRIKCAILDITNSQNQKKLELFIGRTLGSDQKVESLPKKHALSMGNARGTNNKSECGDG